MPIWDNSRPQHMNAARSMPAHGRNASPRAVFRYSRLRSGRVKGIRRRYADLIGCRVASRDGDLHRLIIVPPVVAAHVVRGLLGRLVAGFKKVVPVAFWNRWRCLQKSRVLPKRLLSVALIVGVPLFSRRAIAGSYPKAQTSDETVGSTFSVL